MFMRSSAFHQINSTLWNSVVSFTHFRISNEDYAPIFSVVEVALSGINPFARYCTLSFSERNVLFPGAQSCFTCTCKAAWDAHVVLSHMHMSYCFTCTSKTMLHTEAQGRRIKMRCPVKVLTGIFHPILLSAFWDSCFLLWLYHSSKWWAPFL